MIDPDEVEFRQDDVVRLAATIMDPSAGRSVGPPRLDAAGLIELAGQRPATRRRLPRHLAPLLTAAAAAVILAVVVIVAQRPGSGSLESARPPAAAPVRLDATAAAPVPARGELRRLSGTAGSRPALPRKPVTYVHTVDWALETTGAGPTSSARDDQVWWKADRSARQVTVTLPGWPADPRSTLDAGGQRLDFKPGDYHLVLAEPSSEAHLLAAQLSDHEDFRNGPHTVLRAVRDLSRQHDLTPAVRSAALRFLSDTEGISYRGTVTDAVGRSGILVSADSENGAVRDLALFDAGDGRLLAYQQTSTKDGRTVVTFALLILATGTTDAIGTRVSE